MKFNQAKIIIDYINEEDYEPTDWENNFIESLLDKEEDLSDKQAKCLTNIYEKATGGGVYVK